jgi:hypothetical protein
VTKADAADWIRNNLPTETRDDEIVVIVNHDTDGTTDCSICGRPHTPSKEFYTVDSLAEQYHEAMDPILPDPASDVAQAAIDEAKDRGTGHERFFEQL